MPTDPLFNVLRAYATLQSPILIEKPDVSFSVAHHFLLHHVLLNPHFQHYPPSPRYQTAFWKWAIVWLESLVSDEDELDERIYTYRVELMQAASFESTGAQQPAPSYLTYIWPSEAHKDNPVFPGCLNASLMESRTIVESGTTGMRTWSASLILAQYLLSNPGIISGKRVLELGCGVGFLGAIVASIQSSGSSPTTWLTDVNEPVLQRCAANLSLPCNPSHNHPDLHVKPLDWSDATDPARRQFLTAFFDRAQPDVILGADLVYEPSIIPLLVNVLDVALMPGRGGRSPVAYIALTVRNENTVADFLRQAGETFVVEEVASEFAAQNMFTGTAELGQDATTQVVKVFTLGRKT